MAVGDGGPSKEPREGGCRCARAVFLNMRALAAKRSVPRPVWLLGQPGRVATTDLTASRGNVGLAGARGAPSDLGMLSRPSNSPGPAPAANRTNGIAMAQQPNPRPDWSSD